VALRLHIVLGSIVALATAATVAVAAGPRLDFAYENPSLHVAIETAAALIGSVAAYLALGRFRRRGRLRDLVLFVALVVLATSNLLFSALPGAFAGGESRFTTWAGLAGHLAGAALLAASAFASSRQIRRQGWALRVALLSVAFGLALVATVVMLASSLLPVGVETAPSGDPGAADLDGHVAVLTVQLVAMALFAAAAYGFALRADRTNDELYGWLAAAALLAAFARLNYFLYPSLYADWVYTGDVFRVLFYLALFVGAAREVGGYWRNLAEASVLEERRRIARDLHDGVAQELAYIVRRSRRLAASNGSGVAPIAAAAQRALDDSRRAIAALTRPADEPLDAVLAQATEEVAARLGRDVELDLAQGVAVKPEVREALVRIACEAVANAARHGTGSIRVELEAVPRTTLRVSDEGPGFDPARVRPTSGSGFGLTSMRERAGGLGADFRIHTRPGAGTAIEVVLP
jgi:signal transduction histidine kinase